METRLRVESFIRGCVTPQRRAASNWFQRDRRAASLAREHSSRYK